MKKFSNPFQGMAYITEKGVSPEKVLESYSIIPLNHLLSYLNQPINSFFVGRNGVGKTMVLSLFQTPYQKALFLKTNKKKLREERKEIVKLLPDDVIAIYSNIDSPYTRLTQFQGKVQTDNDWKKSFADYYGHNLIRNLISTIEELSIIKEWRNKNHVAELDTGTLDVISQAYSEKISKELPDAINISSWEGLKTYIDLRIDNWIKVVSKLGADSYSGPTECVQLITPCLLLMKELKIKKVIKEDCRLFIVIDQYEALYEHRKNIDFRSIFNLAMRQAARGETRIEFKIGVRLYGYKDNLKSFGSGSKLDLEKECQEIFIDEITSKYYDKFIEDITRKCLEKTPGYEDYTKNVKKLFVSLEPVQEVREYIGNSEKLDKHFSRFFEKCYLEKENIISNITDLTKNTETLDYKVWIETLLSIYAERFINRNKNNKSLEPLLKEELENRYINLKSILLNHSLSSKSSEYYSYKDLKNGALFFIAASYKNKPKIYSGYETLVDASSRIVLHYIDTVSEAFNSYLLEKRDKIEPLPANLQSDAIYRKANRFFENIPNKVPLGTALSQFLNNLGISFRGLQLDTSLKNPNPNGFSVSKDLAKQFEPESIEADIIIKVLSYGFLEEEKHKDKNRMKGKRYKYYLNRLFCPYFGISIIHGKDPLYIHGNEQEFLKCAMHKECKELMEYFTSTSNFRKDPKKEKKQLDFNSFIII